MRPFIITPFVWLHESLPAVSRLHTCNSDVRPPLSLSLSLSVCLSLSVSLSVSLSISVSLYLCLCLSVSLYLCLCLSLSLSLTLSLSLLCSQIIYQCCRVVLMLMILKASLHSSHIVVMKWPRFAVD